jgi:hypothetical protein
MLANARAMLPVIAHNVLVLYEKIDTKCLG